MTSNQNIADTGDNWDKVLFLFLGWLLGMLSPMIVDAIRRRRELKEVKNALIRELQELQFRLASTAYLTTARLGEHNRSFLNWFKRIIDRYQGPHRSDDLVENIGNQLTWSDAQLAAAGEYQKGNPNKGLGLKMHLAPLLETKVGQLGSFSLEFQNLLLDIHDRLRIVNEEIEQYRFYFKQTFAESLSAVNRKLILENIHGSYKAVSDQAQIICNLIDKVVDIRER